MLKKPLFAAMLALSALLSATSVRADLNATSTSAEHQQPGSAHDDEETNRRLLEQFRTARLSVAEAITAAEQLHPGSRTASVAFELSAPPTYRVLTVKNNEVWENTFDANNADAASAETILSLDELEDDDRDKIIALRSVKQELSDAVRIAERAASGKALGGGLVEQDGKLNFVVVVLSGESLKEVTLEPPKTRRRGSDAFRLTQP